MFAEYLGLADDSIIKEECINKYNHRLDYKKKRFTSGCVAKTFRVCKSECKYVMKVQPLIDREYYKEYIKNEIKLVKYVCKNSNLTGKYYKDWNCNGSNYLVIKYVNGDILSKYPTKKIDKKIIKEMLKSLYRLHKIGVIHRDLKSSNIIITNDGSVKLIDFGQSSLYKKLNKYDRRMAYRWDFKRLLSTLKTKKVNKRLLTYANEYIKRYNLIIQ